MKNLAVIGCGVAAIPILKKARDIGVQTYCFSLFINSEVERLGLYDSHIMVDYYDTDSIVKRCKSIGIDGIIATGENTTASTACVAKQLGLPGNRYDDVFIPHNKYCERKALVGARYVRQPEFQVYDGSIPKFPVVVKAIDSGGKKGISIARNSTEFTQAIKYSNEASNSDTILCEQYLEGGVEYSVECISAKGEHQIIQITQKDVSGPPHFVELGHHQPGCISLNYDKFQKAIFEILDRTGIRNSISHIEVKIIDGEVYFIELGARGGGDRISDTLIYLSTDFDFYKVAILIALGEYNISKDIYINTNHYSGIYFLCKQTQFLKPLFEWAVGKDWCKEILFSEKERMEMNGNDDIGTCDYFIYQSDHKITLKDIPFVFERINNNPCALKMLCEFTLESKRQISESDMVNGMRKFIEKGNVIGCMFDGHLYGMLNIYCNDFDSRDAYINNVEILEGYRGLGLSKRMLQKAYELIVEKQFKTVSLDVAYDNTIALNLYQEEGFAFTGKEQIRNGDTLLEMRKQLV